MSEGILEFFVCGHCGGTGIDPENKSVCFVCEGKGGTEMLTYDHITIEEDN